MTEETPFSNDSATQARARGLHKHFRDMEQSGKPYEGFNRSGKQYVEMLRGVKNVFEHVRSLPVHRVLDVGAGLTRGARDLQQSRLGAGLEFKATVLSTLPEIDQYLGLKNTVETPVEELTGIEDQSCGAVLGVHSIAYSADPVSAVKQLDRVLTPGGVLKTTFKASPHDDEDSLTDVTVPAEMQIHKSFSRELVRLGYDCFIKPSDIQADYDLLIAVKPGSPHTVSAINLLFSDVNTFEDQVKELVE